MNLSKPLHCAEIEAGIPQAAKTPAQRRNWLVTSQAWLQSCQRSKKSHEDEDAAGCRLSVRGPTRTACVSHTNVELASVQIRKLCFAHSESVFADDSRTRRCAVEVRKSNRGKQLHVIEPLDATLPLGYRLRGCGLSKLRRRQAQTLLSELWSL